MKTRWFWIPATICFGLLAFFPVFGWIPVWFAYIAIGSSIVNLSLDSEALLSVFVIAAHVGVSVAIGASFVSLRAGWALAISCLIGIVLFVSFQKSLLRDASFECSDGIWADGTVKFKGRDFPQILFYFEKYKLTEQKDDVTLIRVTPKPRMWWLWARSERSDPMWNVPFGESSDLRPYLGGALSEEDGQEVSRRRDDALLYWIEIDNPNKP